MKRSALLLMAGAMAMGASAQYAPHIPALQGAGRQPHNMVTSARVATPQYRNLAKTTGAPFVTENFSTGTSTTMPTGWTAGAVQGNATWKWRNVACTGQYSIGVINSATAANGWMVYDSDSIGALTSAVKLEGWLQSPSYVCTGHASVGLSFQEWFRAFNDSCFVQVSNNNGASWVTFPINANNSLSNNDDLATNPTTVKINISSVAANQANVKIRFRYTYDGAAGGGYNWLVDDVALYELDPVEVSIQKSFLYGNWGQYGSSVATVPLQFVDTITPFTKLSNNGSNAQSNVGLTANIYRNGSSVYTKSVTYATLPVSAEDSLVDFVTTYLPNATGNYVVAVNATQAGDADLTNNRDTALFTVTDTIWAQNSTNTSGSFSVHRAPAGGQPEASFYVGTRFDVPIGKKDTLTAVSVAFGSSTDPNSAVRVQIYKAGTTKWDIRAATLIKTLTAADISSTTTAVYARLEPDFTGVTINDFILDEGSYAVVVAPHQVPTANDVTVIASSPSNATLYAGYFGQSGTATNDGNTYDFGTTFATGMTSIPLIRLHFGNASKLSVNNMLVTLAGNAYPNPANNTVNIPFSVKEAANVEIEISNVVGQVVNTRSVGAVSAGQTREEVISTNELSNGLYIYTVKANGQSATGKFVVTH